MPLPAQGVLLLILAVSVDHHVPNPIVTRALTEARAIWRDAGVQIEWRKDDGTASRDLHVVFGDFHRHSAPGDVPIAWIDAIDGVPVNVIHVSREAANELLEADGRVPSEMKEIPAATTEFLGRALGRALAHEIGHYLLRSRDHDRRGLMATRRTSVELFGPDRSPFAVTPSELARVVASLDRSRAARGSNQ